MYGMAAAFSHVAGGSERREPRVVRRSRFLVVSAVLVCAVVLLGADIWIRGGTFLVRGGLNESFGPQPVGVPVSFGVDLQTRGSGGVVLGTASAKHTADVTISYAVVYTAPDADGVGTVIGSVSLANTMPVRGAKMEEPVWKTPAETCTPADPDFPIQCTPSLRDQPRHGAFWLVVTVTPVRPGAWAITDIRLSYKSWWRSRVASMAGQVTGSATSS